MQVVVEVEPILALLVEMQDQVVEVLVLLVVELLVTELLILEVVAVEDLDQTDQVHLQVEEVDQVVQE
jgi:hypothetical protein|tara:strand:- start:986 stop:1189 length:204 start_codon:yes stop_codon:yes gene_type:complete